MDLTRRRPGRISPEEHPSRRGHDRPAWLGPHSARWLVVAISVALVGSGATLFAAHNAARDNTNRQHQAFAASSASIAATLKLAISHEADLIVGASAYVAANPSATSSGFAQWVTSEGAYQRYPELRSLTYSSTAPPGAADMSAVTVRNSGVAGYTVLRSNRSEAVLAVLIPVYRGGAIPTVSSKRRAAFLGWIGFRFVPGILLNQAMVGHSDMALRFRLHAGLTDVGFRWGKVAGPTQSRTVGFLPPWSVVVSGPLVATTILGSAGLLLLGGVALSLLVGMFVFTLGTGRDRARRLVKLRTGELRHQALHDALTELPNRALVLDRADQMLARGRRHQAPVAAMCIDLDVFKRVNDSFGQAVGDDVLREVSLRLQGFVRDGDTVARMGADEFVVLVEGQTLDAGPELVAERLLEVLRQPHDLKREGGGQLVVTASIGIATSSVADVDELLGNADLALFEAKAAGRNGYMVFESSMQSSLKSRLMLQMDLAEALERDELFLLYQPTFDLTTGQAVGTEALLRWRHPTRGVVSPEEFIPVAEESGLIVAIGRWVLNDACRQAVAWNARGYPIGMAVNVSARQLDRDELIEEVRAALDDSGLDPGMLTLEVTETALMRDTDAAAQRLKLLKQLGVRIAIDDFGTGYSSLAYLRKFPVDVLKIDRSFVSGIDASDKSAALVHTLIALGKALDLATLAEGIETHEQLLSLQLEQCDYGQGYLYSKPLDAAVVEVFLSAIPAQPLSLR